MFSLGRSWGDGWSGGAGFHRPVQGSRYYFPRTSPAAVSHHHKPCPRYSDGRGRMRATPSPRHLEGKGDRRQSPRGRGEGRGRRQCSVSYSSLRLPVEFRAWHLNHCPQHPPQGRVGKTLRARSFPSSWAASAKLLCDLGVLWRATRDLISSGLPLIPGTKSSPSTVCSYYVLGLFD